MSSTSPSSPAGRLSLLGRRRRIEQFAQLLEGAPVSADLASSPQLAPLVDLAAALRAVPLGPTPDFQTALRKRLVAVAGVQGAGEVSLPAAVRAPATGTGLGSVPERLTEWAEGWRVRGRFIAATAAASAVVIVGGVGLAGSRSLPGQPFYGVKRGVERVQLALAGSTEARGERHLEFAHTRLHEVATLVHSPQAIGIPARHHDVAGGTAIGGSLTSRVVSTLHAMDNETTAGTKDLTTAYVHSHDGHALQVLTRFASRQQTTLTAVMPSLPSGAATQAQTSLALIQRVDSRAMALLAAPSCTAACMPQSSGTPNPSLTPAPGDDLGPAPCSCTQHSDGSSGSQPQGPQPAPTGTPKPAPAPTSGGGGGSSPPPTAPKPSPTPTTLQSQIGSILSQLPLPVTPPPLPLPTLPVPTLGVPTIGLGGH
ncbi:MAG: DUF5667 domain-containing protein [Actinomycetes bacterium]